jgi:hypothetical protein
MVTSFLFVAIDEQLLVEFAPHEYDLALFLPRVDAPRSTVAKTYFFILFSFCSPCAFGDD